MVEKKLSHPQRAVFLDRDGTINKYVGFLRDINDLELIPGVAEAIKRINESGFLAIVITNQPVIARGEVTVDELNLIHAKMETLLGAAGAYLDAIYYCPHHPDRRFEGEIEFLKIVCDCRKPKPELAFRAVNDFNIDLNNSIFIGDTDTDIQTAHNAHLATAVLYKGVGSAPGCRNEGTSADAVISSWSEIGDVRIDSIN